MDPLEANILNVGKSGNKADFYRLIHTYPELNSNGLGSRLLSAAIKEKWDFRIVKVLVDEQRKFFDWTISKSASMHLFYLPTDESTKGSDLPGQRNMPGPLNRAAATDETLETFIVIAESAKQFLTFSDPRDSGRTPLHAACRAGASMTVDYLLKQNEIQTIIDSKDDQGRTPLSYASEYGHVRIAYSLLSSGKPDYKAKDNGGRSPLDYSEGCYEIWWMLSFCQEKERRGIEGPILDFGSLIRHCALFRVRIMTHKMTGQ